MKKGGGKTSLPEIKEGIKILWECGRYDGPLSGIVEYQGKKCYFDIKHEYDSRYWRNKVYRTFWIYELTQAQWEEQQYWHNEFSLHVGPHTNYADNEDGSRGRQEHFSNDMNYCKEMFYDRHEAWKKEKDANGGTEMSKLQPGQRIGWCIYDVIFNRPWEEWRRPRVKREKKNKGTV